jgi:hypothetical protein
MAQRVQIEIQGKDNASAQLKGVSGQLEVLKARFEAGGPAVGKLNGALQDIGKNMVGLQGNIGKLASALLSFGPQGAVIAGAVAGVSIFINKLGDLSTASEKTLTQQNEQYKTILGLNLEALSIQGETAQASFYATVDALRVAKQELVNINADIKDQEDLLTTIQERLKTSVVLSGGYQAQREAIDVKLNALETKRAEQLAKIRVEELKQGVATVRVYGEEKKSLEELAKSGKLTEEQQRTLAFATEQLNRIVKDGAKPAFLRTLARDALEVKTTQDKREATVDLIQVDKDRLTILYALRDAGQLNLSQLQQISTLEQQYEQILNDENQTLATRAQALDILSEKFGVMSKAQEDSRRKGEQWSQGLITQINALRQYSDDATGATISVVNRAGPNATGQDIMFLEDRLRQLQMELLGVSDIIQQNNIESQIIAIQQALDSTFKTQEDKLNTLTTVADLAASSWELMFSVIGQGGNAMRNFGTGFARMIGQMAKVKMLENVAAAVENYAKSAGWIALGNVASSAAAKTAAIGHTKAAAAWGVLAGGGAALGGNGGAPGGAGGSGFSRSDLGGLFPEPQNNVTIIFPDGLIDLSNPNTQREFSKLINQVASNRQINFVGVNS